MENRTLVKQGDSEVQDKIVLLECEECGQETTYSQISHESGGCPECDSPRFDAIVLQRGVRGNAYKASA